MTNKKANKNVARGIYGAIAYFDYFNRPLNIKEIHKFLYKTRASQIEIELEIENNKELKKLIEEHLNYFCLRGRKEIVDDFLDHKETTKKFWNENVKFLKLLKAVPFIKMVAIGGSFSREMVNDLSDFDLYIVAKNNRIYLTRAFINFINKKIRAARKLDKDLLQVAFVFSERHLNFLKPECFLASEILSLIWVHGSVSPVDILDNNKWVQNYFPNGYRMEIYQNDKSVVNIKQNAIARFFQSLFSGVIGNFFEGYFKDKTVRSMSSEFDDKYWAQKESIGLRKDKPHWRDPEKKVDKLIQKIK